MDYNQIEKILKSFGLEEHSNSEGTHFTFTKGNNHRIIFERLRPLTNGGAGGYLYAVVLEDCKSKCSKNGHICVSKLRNESELRTLVERVINHFDSIY
ncbi:DOG1 domain-containing protein [Clostridium tagluense]|uniref:DOG1 domain-containing protein n=1 Tax=Clostridium tagluense TaxID=360422 RepID=UPI001CF55E92|nr:DOG1 domain-containing protein [Clostridium tagluense]MCB2313258.1 DOG1 domain-containing protein [Clostridium tagluense]MCB2317991.1 DOG1 domain-containing protein [Clostridium tagluense]MCB2322813.1 DOG1 domain-containing protein [Clostridium tagluense]MCB2327775.1 DOG1 domain-containing protein [Clostridium tagluense]MCB2332422.1 DOG1 domain-containing protein [Clostridium tagluense]